MEALDRADAAAGDSDLADIEQVALPALTIREAVCIALANRLGQGVDRELGGGIRPVNDDAKLAARHGIDADGADWLGEFGG